MHVHKYGQWIDDRIIEIVDYYDDAIIERKLRQVKHCSVCNKAKVRRIKW